MAMIKFGKDEVSENTNDFALLPAAKYTAQICNHEWKATKAGGHLLALTLEITGPSHEGRKVFDNLNIDCTSEDAQKIALRSYKAICLACKAEGYYDGIFEIDEATFGEYFEALPENLYGQNIAINVGVEKSKDAAYSDKNKIKQYGEASATNSKPTIPAGKSVGKPKPSWQK